MWAKGEGKQKWAIGPPMAGREQRQSECDGDQQQDRRRHRSARLLTHLRASDGSQNIRTRFIVWHRSLLLCNEIDSRAERKLYHSNSGSSRSSSSMHQSTTTLNCHSMALQRRRLRPMVRHGGREGDLSTSPRVPVGPHLSSAALRDCLLFCFFPPSPLHGREEWIQWPLPIAPIHYPG